MRGKSEQIVQELRDRILRTVQPEAILLFGSRARGDFDEDSDFDLLVVEPNEFISARQRREHLTRIRNAVRDMALPLDVVLVSRTEVDKWRQSVNHVVARSLAEGRFLHGSL